MPSRFKSNDDEFSSQATDLVAYISANKARLEVTDTKIAALNGEITPFPTALGAFKSAAVDYKLTSDAKVSTRKNGESALSSFIDNLGDRFTNADRIANGIPPLEGRGGKRPTPTETPMLRVTNGASGELMVLILDSQNPTKAGKPEGVDDAEIRWDEADSLDADPDDWHPGPTPSDLRSNVKLKFKPILTGKSVKIIARYRNASGEGDWSAPADGVIA